MSDKRPLDWHRRGIQAHEANLAADEDALARQTQHVVASRARLEFAKAQLAEAERRGLDGYDNSRFMVRRKGDGA